MSIKFLVLGGGVFWGLGGGGKCRFFVYGREDFSESRVKSSSQALGALEKGEAFLLTVGAFLLTVKLCSNSVLTKRGFL